jgi:hypothetical protein
MRLERALLVIAAVVLASATAEGRVVHGYSAIFALDTVTAAADGAGGTPQATVITAIYPNPFNPRTTIAFDVAEAGSIELAIYDLRGRRVRVVEAGTWPVGRYEAIWDGQDDDGRAAPTGTYCCRLATTGGAQTMKLTLAR